MVDSSADMQNKEPRGFGGWLRAWLVLTFILQPLGVVFSAFYPSTPQTAGHVFFSGAFVVFLVWMWTVVARKNAQSLRWIRAYLRLMLVLASLLLISGIGYSVDASRIKNNLAISFDESLYQDWVEKTDAAGTLIVNSFLTYLYVLLSWAYFHTSRRVRNTFGANIGSLWG
jgi:hypothetical protein